MAFPWHTHIFPTIHTQAMGPGGYNQSYHMTTLSAKVTEALTFPRPGALVCPCQLRLLSAHGLHIRDLAVICQLGLQALHCLNFNINELYCYSYAIISFIIKSFLHARPYAWCYLYHLLVLPRTLCRITTPTLQMENVRPKLSSLSCSDGDSDRSQVDKRGQGQV